MSIKKCRKLLGEGIPWSKLLILLIFLAACGTHVPPPTPPPPPTEVCGNGVCAGSETPANCPADCKLPPPPPPATKCGDGVCNALETCETCAKDCGECPPPPPPPVAPAKGLSISFYHGLTADKYLLPNKKQATFDYLAYLEYLGSIGVRDTRVFTELPWWLTDVQKFESAWVIMPYRSTGHNAWDFDSANRLNPDFLDRIKRGGDIARKWKMTILLVFATQGPDYGCPWFNAMGYPGKSKEYYEKADFPQYQSKAWPRFLRYYEDMARATKGYEDVYKVFEPYNEHSSGSVLDELKGIRKAVDAGGRKDYQMRLNFPNPVYGAPFGDMAEYMAWLKKLTTLYGLNARSLSFHGVFTPNGVTKIAVIMRQYGFKTEQVYLSTDGTTQAEKGGKPLFTEESHFGHYKWRPLFDDSAANLAGTISAHQKYLRACKQEMFAGCDVQGVLKWQLDAIWTTPANLKFDAGMVSVMQ